MCNWFRTKQFFLLILITFGLNTYKYPSDNMPPKVKPMPIQTGSPHMNPKGPAANPFVPKYNPFTGKSTTYHAFATK